MRKTSREVCARMKNELTSFRFLTDDDVPEIADYFSCRQVEAGEILWREGDPCGFLVFIVEGKVGIEKETEFAGKQIIMGVHGKGSVIGELCILDQTPRAVTAVALENSNLLLLSRENFEILLREHPVLGVKLLEGMLLSVSTRLKKTFDRLTSIF